VVPRWATTKTQPIAVDDVVRYLVGVGDHPRALGRTFDVGGPDQLTYVEMLQRAAEIRTGSRVPLVTVPVRVERSAFGPATLVPVAAIGIFDLLANFLFVVAAGRGLLSVVGVLGSLYPAVTVVLARFVLHERLTRSQGAGVVITLTGVVALAAG